MHKYADEHDTATFNDLHLRFFCMLICYMNTGLL